MSLPEGYLSWHSLVILRVSNNLYSKVSFSSNRELRFSSCLGEHITYFNSFQVDLS
jgi:hypothetical protein